jgi:hypothetical protein
MTLWANQQGAAEAQRGLSGEEIVRGTAQRQSLPTQCRTTMCVFILWAVCGRRRNASSRGCRERYLPRPNA